VSDLKNTEFVDAYDPRPVRLLVGGNRRLILTFKNFVDELRDSGFTDVKKIIMIASNVLNDDIDLTEPHRPYQTDAS
jgi:hypothetical protein